MAFLAKGDVLVGNFLLTKRAAALSPNYALIATDPRRLLDERVAAAMSAEAMEVALSNPIRQGDAGKRAGDALDAYCKRLRLRPECYRAGCDYDQQVRAEKTARGFVVEGTSPPPDGIPILSEAEAQAKREAAIMALGVSDGILILVHARCPRRMVLLCFDRLPPSLYDEGILTNGLLSLSRHYGLLDEGINRDKPI